VERVNVSTDPSRGGVSILVRRRGTRRRETLASLGDGMQHLFALALGLAQARGGLFLADEIENGLHYSVHEAMWRFIATTAARLGAQVVATTHSWDCIEGFQAAGIEDSLLIRLDRRGEDTFAVLFDERDVAIATRQSIDVR
jgi:predicted ATPase